MIKKLTTPYEINSDIIRLCEQIGNVENPIFIDVKPRSDSIVNECYIDVENQIKEFGGAIQYGWMVWILENAYLEATFHAIWKTPEEKFIDITTKEDNESKILFIPDNNRKFNNYLIPSIRLALTFDPLLFEWVETQSKIEKIKSEKTKDKGFNTNIKLIGHEYDTFIKAQELERQVATKYRLLSPTK